MLYSTTRYGVRSSGLATLAQDTFQLYLGDNVFFRIPALVGGLMGCVGRCRVRVAVDIGQLLALLPRPADYLDVRSRDKVKARANVRLHRIIQLNIP